MSDDLIQPGEVKAVLQTSGYLLEGRVASVLQMDDWYVQMNNFFPDLRDSTRSIEIDVQAGLLDTHQNPDQSQSTICVSLLIECKNNSQPVAFFLRREPAPNLSDGKIIYHGFPFVIPDPEDNKRQLPTPRVLSMQKWHHYCTEGYEIATQFCGFKRVGEEQSEKKKIARDRWRWKDERMQQYSQSFTDLVIAAYHDPGGSLDQPTIELMFCFPVVVFQGPIYAVRVDGTDVRVSETDCVQLSHSAVFGGRILSAQIDVVTENHFPALLKTIREESSRIFGGIRDHYQTLMLSAIVQKAYARQHWSKDSPVIFR